MKRSFAYKLLKRTKNWTSSFLHQLYENSVAVFLARYFYFLYFPLYLYYSKKNICFVFNVADGPGHLIPETDYFLRSFYLGKIDKKKKYVFLRKKTPFSEAFCNLYSHHFYWAKANTYQYYLYLPMLIHYKQLTFDAGYCRIKWQAPTKNLYNLNYKHPFVYQMPKAEGARRFSMMFLLRKESENLFPLLDMRNDKSTEFLDLFELREKKYCVIHLKQRVCNATATLTDPNTYLKSLHFLKNHGYQLVFGGRETMPKIFEQLGIINYANSKFANFQNDIYLFKNAFLAITGGSGINMLGDYYNTPVLYLNSWHTTHQFFHRTSICVPARVQRKGGSFLTFSEQSDLVFSNDGEIHEIFPYEDFHAVNANEEEIYQGLLELIDVIKNNIPTSHLYAKYVEICNRHDLLTYCNSRISRYFLEQYKMLIK